MKMWLNFLVETVLVLGLMCVLSSRAAKDLPPSFPRCHRLDPKLNDCLLKATETVKPMLRKGVPDFKFPPLDNFSIPEITLQQGSQALNFKAKLTDVVVNGLGNYKFSRYEYDVPNNLFTVQCIISPLELEGDYTVDGRLLIAPIQGKGKFKAGIETTTVNLTQKVSLVKKKDGEDYIQPVYTKTNIDVSGPKAHLDGLFNGNEELNAATNKAIEENIDLLFEDLKPVIEKIVSSLIEELIFNVIEDKIPYKKLYENAPLPKT